MPKPFRVRPSDSSASTEVQAPRTSGRRGSNGAANQRTLRAADACAHGELGAMLRKEGVYHSQVAVWPRQLAESGSALGAAFARAHDTGGVLSLALADIDHFKQINDSYSHVAGDAVLRSVADRLANTMPGNAIVARFGGEEYAILLPGLESDAARAACERMREKIAESPVIWESKAILVTISFGVAQLKADDDSPNPLLSQADQQLYSAKGEGRNRVS